MKPLLFFVTLALLTLFNACSSSQQSTDITLPSLMFQEPLPTFPKPITTPTLRIALQIHVKKDGSVDEVRILNTSGNIAWDSAALAAIRLWRYAPARIGGTPINIWLNQTAIVTFSEPHYIALAQILCGTAEQADTIYTLLKQGSDFATIALRYSTVPSEPTRHVLGSINIQVYPQQIKKALARLQVDQFTEPLPYGER